MQASERANPPPSKRITPHGSFFSISSHDTRDGDFAEGSFRDWKGQNLYWVGNAKMTMTMSRAGVASPTVDLFPLSVILLRKSPQPAINIGSLLTNFTNHFNNVLYSVYQKPSQFYINKQLF